MRKNKYNARPTIIDGIRFASAKEAKRYQELLILLRANKIGYLERQPAFDLHAGKGNQRVRIGEYRADFRYIDNATGESIVEDVKSRATAKIQLYRWKLKHVAAEHGIRVREVI